MSSKAFNRDREEVQKQVSARQLVPKETKTIWLEIQTRMGFKYTGRQVGQIRVITEVGKQDNRWGHIRKSQMRENTGNCNLSSMFWVCSGVFPKCTWGAS